MIKVDNLSFKPNFTQADVKQKLANSLKVDVANILNYVILKQSIDARRKPDVKIILSVAVNVKNKKSIKGFLNIEPNFEGLKYDKQNLNVLNPVVVGFGPAGMFCALALSLMGLNPIVVEQGLDVDAREKEVFKFWETGKLNKTCNVQFGEGGAGTFSDGKLNTNLNNPYCGKVINEFVLNGAPSEIAYINKPHIGSDNLKTVVKNIRNKIINNGGKVLFNTQFVDYELQNGTVSAVIVKNLENGAEYEIKTNNVVLALGHSAKDSFNLLYNKGIQIKQKPFAMGVRIEQLQSQINKSQYGKEQLGLPSADYKLAVHLPNGRSVFTFCMCPGGVVVNSASDQNEVVTNGMSYFARDGKNANSAVLCNVNPTDFNSDHPLAGIYFQQKYERLAFDLTKNHICPAQSVGEFLTGEKHKLKVEPSTKVTFANLKQCLPNFVYESLKQALPLLDNKLKGFSDYGNLLIGIESRSSSPVTIVRDDNFESSEKGIYPCGEGAGYAGGIISSAVDGIKVAEAILKNIKK